jgi:single-strand DNA-binding protein
MVMREFSIDVELWGALCLKHQDDIVEGNKLVVLGKLKLESWTDTSGAKRYKHVVTANQLEITGAPVPSLEDEVMKQREHVLYEENPF